MSPVRDAIVGPRIRTPPPTPITEDALPEPNVSARAIAQRLREQEQARFGRQQLVISPRTGAGADERQVGVGG